MVTVTRSPALKWEPATTSGLLFAIASRGTAADADGTTTATASAAMTTMRLMPEVFPFPGGLRVVALGLLQLPRVVDVDRLPLGEDVERGLARLAMAVARLLHAA